MPQQKSKLKGIFVQLQGLSADELEQVLQVVTTVKSKLNTSSMQTAMSGKLKTLDDFKTQLTTFISEWWENDEVEAWSAALAAKAGSQGAADLKDIVTIAGDASNARNELENMSDEEDDYAEIEAGMEEDIGKSLDMLEAFWAKYVGSKQKLSSRKVK